MNLKCKACGTSFSSLLIPAESAALDLTNQLTQHVSIRHPEIIAQVSETIRMLTWLIFIEAAGEPDEGLAALVQKQRDLILTDK